MHPHRRAGRLEGGRAPREARGEEARENVARARRRQPWRQVVRDGGAAVRMRDDVSAPFSSTIAPVSRAAARARASFEGERRTSRRASEPCETESGSRAELLKSLANSPSCGVRTTSPAKASTASASTSPRPRSSSAHRRRARHAALAALDRAASTQARRPSPTPAPGPSTSALNRRSSSSAASSPAPSHGASMIAVSCAALTASASRGEAMVTSPAPPRSAPAPPAARRRCDASARSGRARGRANTCDPRRRAPANFHARAQAHCETCAGR